MTIVRIVHFTHIVIKWKYFPCNSSSPQVVNCLELLECGGKTNYGSLKSDYNEPKVTTTKNNLQYTILTHKEGVSSGEILNITDFQIILDSMDRNPCNYNYLNLIIFGT